ncbi:4-hydroxy-tetrahydrodipicolinate synthase [Bradyrhizobium elkanii]
MSKARKGVYAAAITPIAANGDPSLNELVRYCEGLIEAGCDGVAPLGTTGEAASLPLSFRQVVPEALAAANLASDRVILGVGSASVGDVIALARISLGAGYANLLVLPPYYTKDPSEDGLYDYYSRIIDSVGDNRLRIYLYHIPQVTLVPISRKLVERLRAAFGPVIAGLKDSSGSFDSAKSYLGFDDFDVFPSSEAYLSEALDAGCAGVISGSTNISASLAYEVLRAQADRRDGLQAALTDFRLTIQKFPLIPAVKQIHAWRTGNANWVRLLPPLRELTAEQLVALRHEMTRLGQVRQDQPNAIN